MSSLEPKEGPPHTSQGCWGQGPAGHPTGHRAPARPSLPPSLHSERGGHPLPDSLHDPEKSLLLPSGSDCGVTLTGQ